MVLIRPATPADAPSMADVQFAAFRHDELNNWLCPQLDKHPYDLSRAMKIRAKTALLIPGNVVMVAVAEATDSGLVPGELIGFATWNRRSKDPSDAVQVKWTRDRLAWKFERWALGWEKWYQETVMDYATDWDRVRRFYAHVMVLTIYDSLEAYWHLNVIAVHPAAQRRNVGTRLLDWGMETARDEGVPVTLEAAPTAKKLYWKAGFKTFEVLNVEGVELQPAHAMLWEPEGKQGEWLQDDGEGIVTLKGYVRPTKSDGDGS
ncbi:acyl-CoA N-acyltransferase [Pseudovirgaria hyperparasitica]|uniref:Acyl-CoA N-acyltransferase n=1 Tax=Pseudovirgaria hyperparasitica TaxID=470096 RepID=A0A6A6W717_9PEZI|nr:acyl-CoA N-acyltransferase [Pseudovirgaria hyperparasitica]KAF2756871.1 acyl-CoA N-acyltransferase [Pseudovirgaria hyperparasitica]